MDRRNGSKVRAFLKGVAVVGAVACGIAVAGIALLAVVVHQALEGFDEIGKTGCADSDVELVAAAARGDIDVVRRELDHGTKVGETDSDGNSALACAGPRGHEAVVALLLDRGAKPLTYARDGDTVLADAVRFCQPKVADLLIRAGADPDASGRDVSLLDEAARVGDPQLTQVLLDGGADPASFTGDAAGLDYGVESTSECAVPTDADRAATLAALGAGGADPSAVLGGAVQLPVAVGGPLVTDAIGRGADPNSKAAGPVVALATAGRDPDMVAVLLAAGADPNRGPAPSAEPEPADPGQPTTTTTLPPFELFGASLCEGPIDPMRCDVSLALRQFSSTTTYGGTGPTMDGGEVLGARDRATAPPLLIAAWDGDAEIVRLLLDAGADPRALSADGYGPLHAAAAGGDTGIVQLLLAAGAAQPVSGEAVAPSTIAANAGRKDLARVLEAAGR